MKRFSPLLNVGQPALLSVDKHRPDDAKAYLASFLGACVSSL